MRPINASTRVSRKGARAFYVAPERFFDLPGALLIFCPLVEVEM